MKPSEGITILALVRDRPGVLNRVSSMFRRRGFNITSLAVGNCEEPGMSRMTFVVEGDDSIVHQVVEQLRKLIDIAVVQPLDRKFMISRELALIRVKSDTSNRGEIREIAELYRANIIDVAHDSLIIEVTGDVSKVQSLNDLLSNFGVTELIRTGRVAMVRGMAQTSLRKGKSIST